MTADRPVLIVDVDGTLVDSNYHHALAWGRAFQVEGVFVPHWLIHRAIGMGGDQLVGALAGDAVETEKGDEIRAAEKRLYGGLIDEVRPFPDVAATLAMLRDGGFRVTLASSAKADEVDRYLDMLTAQGDTEIREVIDGWTTSADVEATKPEPDLMRAALELVGADAREATMLGDSIWDIEAASRAGIESLGVLTGGFATAELEGAGAAEVADTFADAGERLLRAGVPAR